jgi:signal transduction histidine kinase
MGSINGDSDQIIGGPFVNGVPTLIAAAHELKSPLALVRQLSLMLEDDDLTELERKRMLRQISLTSERALRLTSDLTRSVKMDDALFKLEPINPQQLCEDIIHELRPLFVAHNREVRLAPRRHPLLMVANRDLIRRIIMNFSDNALHYAECDSSVEIKVGLLDAGRTVRVGVRDYGPALPKNTLHAIKNKVDSSMPIHARPQSSGLGLYISTQFADAMNGRIGVTQHRDGATFYIDLQASRQLSLL